MENTNWSWLFAADAFTPPRFSHHPRASYGSPPESPVTGQQARGRPEAGGSATRRIAAASAPPTDTQTRAAAQGRIRKGCVNQVRGAAPSRETPGAHPLSLPLRQARYHTERLTECVSH